MNYKSIGFALSEVKLEDSWLVDFMPSLTQVSKFLKYKGYSYQHKAFESDGMNGFGKNIISGEKRKPTDMIEYWNFYLADEAITTTRNKYSWLDNCAFIGGNIDFILMIIGIFFSLYNYKIADIEDFYNLLRSKAAKNGGLQSNKMKLLEKYSFTISFHMLLTDVKGALCSCLPCCKSKKGIN